MAYQKSYCANESCSKHTTYTGGTFVFSLENRKLYCEDCFHVKPQLNDCKELYSFTTTHLNGKPIEVRGKAHLQQLEKEFGVSHHQLNNDEAHWNTPPTPRSNNMPRELHDLLMGARR